MNNFERIKNMTLDEMAKFLDETPCLHCIDYKNKGKYCLRKCKQRIKQWLQQESEG